MPKEESRSRCGRVDDMVRFWPIKNGNGYIAINLELSNSGDSWPKDVSNLAVATAGALARPRDECDRREPGNGPIRHNWRLGAVRSPLFFLAGVAACIGVRLLALLQTVACGNCLAVAGAIERDKWLHRHERSHEPDPNLHGFNVPETQENAPLSGTQWNLSLLSAARLSGINRTLTIVGTALLALSRICLPQNPLFFPSSFGAAPAIGSDPNKPRTNATRSLVVPKAARPCAT